MTTIYNIAEQAGVSVATVSRVINGREGLRNETRDRVQKAMDEMDFRPRLKALDVNRVLVLVPEHEQALKSRYLGSLLSGITDQAFAADLSLSLHPFADALYSGTEMRHLVRSEGAIGAILISMAGGYEIASRLSLEGVPHVVVGPTNSKQASNSIVANDSASAMQATEFLKSLGHSNIAMMTFRLTEASHRLRYEGYRQAMDEKSSGPTAAPPICCDFLTQQSVDSALTMLLSSRPRPTSVIVTNETLTLLLMRAARARGLRVPEDLSVLSYESSNILEFIDPPITALHTPAYEMGQCAMKQLIGLQGNSEHSITKQSAINDIPIAPGTNETNKNVVELSHSIVIRQSTSAITNGHDMAQQKQEENGELDLTNSFEVQTEAKEYELTNTI